MFVRAPALKKIPFWVWIGPQGGSIHWCLRLIWLMALSDNIGKYHVKIYCPVPMLHIAYSCVDINSSLWNMHWRVFPLVELVMPDKYICAFVSWLWRGGTQLVHFFCADKVPLITFLSRLFEGFKTNYFMRALLSNATEVHLVLISWHKVLSFCLFPWQVLLCIKCLHLPWI